MAETKKPTTDEQAIVPNTPAVASTREAEVAVEPAKPKEYNRLEDFAGDVEVQLSAPFWTNGVQFGPKKEYNDDEDPTFVTVKVDQSTADDLRRRQSVYDRARRERFISRKGGNFTPDQT